MILRRKFNGAKLYTEAWDMRFFRSCMVGELCMRDEVAAEAAVECIEVRMPE